MDFSERSCAVSVHTSVFYSVCRLYEYVPHTHTHTHTHACALTQANDDPRQASARARVAKAAEEEEARRVTARANLLMRQVRAVCCPYHPLTVCMQLHVDANRDVCTCTWEFRMYLIKAVDEEEDRGVTARANPLMRQV